MDSAVQIIFAGGLTGSLLMIVALARSGYGERPPASSYDAEQPTEKER